MMSSEGEDSIISNNTLRIRRKRKLVFKLARLVKFLSEENQPSQVFTHSKNVLKSLLSQYTHAIQFCPSKNVLEQAIAIQILKVAIKNPQFSARLTELLKSQDMPCISEFKSFRDLPNSWVQLTKIIDNYSEYVKQQINLGKQLHAAFSTLINNSVLEPILVLMVRGLGLIGLSRHKKQISAFEEGNEKQLFYDYSTPCTKLMIKMVCQAIGLELTLLSATSTSLFQNSKSLKIYCATLLQIKKTICLLAKVIEEQLDDHQIDMDLGSEKQPRKRVRFHRIKSVCNPPQIKKMMQNKCFQNSSFTEQTNSLNFWQTPCISIGVQCQILKEVEVKLRTDFEFQQDRQSIDLRQKCKHWSEKRKEDLQIRIKENSSTFTK